MTMKRMRLETSRRIPTFKPAKNVLQKVKNSTPDAKVAVEITEAAVKVSILDAKAREAKEMKNAKARDWWRLKLAIPGFRDAKNAKAREKKRIRVHTPEAKAAAKEKRDHPDAKEKAKEKQRIRNNIPENKVKIQKQNRVRTSTPEYKAAMREKNKALYANETPEARKARNAKNNKRRSTPAAKAKAKIKRDDPATKEKERIHRATPEYRAIANARTAARKLKSGIVQTIRKKNKSPAEARVARLRKISSPLYKAAQKQKMSTPEYKAMLAKKRSTPQYKAVQVMIRSTPQYKAVRAKHNSTPAYKLKAKLRAAKRAAKITKKKMDRAWEFIEAHGIDIGGEPMTDEEAFQFVVKLIDDSESVVGKTIFEALGGMTLRTAFWEGKSDHAMYALMSRGDATMGESTAEFTRFILKNPVNIPVLTRGDNNERFKYTDEAFKDLGLVYCPIRACSTYADISTLECAFQLLFDFLEVGSQRLWKVSGVGKSPLPLRKCDKLCIERTNDTNLRFMFGITILKHVKVVSRTTGANGRDKVVCITGGQGTKCNVNQRRRRAPIINESQKTALANAQAILPPNFMDQNRKRKADVLDMQAAVSDFE
ncbi:hypothetical protein T484DRAFT_1757149 [Baffinella frigidus]|nr:hypothetical protein T484DRAFT_1757149 [Cryptophyta sp. CCMP2293]